MDRSQRSNYLFDYLTKFPDFMIFNPTLFLVKRFPMISQYFC